MIKKHETLEDTIKRTLSNNSEFLNTFMTNYIKNHLSIDYTDKGRDEHGNQKIGLAIYIDNTLVLESNRKLCL